MRMRAKIARKMSFDPDRNYLQKWIEVDPDRIWFGTTEVDLSGSDLDNVSIDRPLDLVHMCR